MAHCTSFAETNFFASCLCASKNTPNVALLPSPRRRNEKPRWPAYYNLGGRPALVCRQGPRVAGRSKVLGPPPKETPVTFSTGGENRALQPDILIMLRADSKRGNEYSSEFNMENTTGGARVPGPFVRHRVLAGAGR
jgi:hypothetical protein